MTTMHRLLCNFPPHAFRHKGGGGGGSSAAPPVQPAPVIAPVPVAATPAPLYAPPGPAASSSGPETEQARLEAKRLLRARKGIGSTILAGADLTGANAGQSALGGGGAAGKNTLLGGG